jgi:hypothetical protein
MTKNILRFIVLFIFFGAASPAFCNNEGLICAPVYSPKCCYQDTFKLFIAEFSTVVLPHKETPGDMKTPAKYEFQQFFPDTFNLAKVDVYCDKLLYENDRFVVVSFDNYYHETRASEEYIICYDKNTKKITGQISAGVDDSKKQRHDYYTVSFDSYLVIGLSGKVNVKLNEKGAFEGSSTEILDIH